MHCLLIAVWLVLGATATNVIEMYVAIDQRVVQDYINHGSTVANAEDDARTDAEFFLQEVNNIFDDMGTGVQIRIRQMDVLAQNVFNDCQLRDGEGIHEDLGLQTFLRYVQDQGLSDSINYDMALLWTGFNIYGQSDSTAGYATVGSMCTENAVTIVEYDGTYRTVHVTAHEIGHVLGLNHDEGACDNNYIMTETLSGSLQRWSFSSCSLDAIADLVPSKTCLTDTNAASQIPEEGASDALLDPDDVCKRGRNDTNSYMCKTGNLYNNNPPQGDIVCERFFCYDPVTTYCYSAYTTNGMICGVDDRCSNEQCVTAPADFPTPSGLDANCLYGDAAVLRLSGVSETTCSDFFAPASNRFQCYSVSIELACCATCESLKGDIPGCAYGDRSSQCVNYPQASVCPTYGDDLCCEYCSTWSGKRSAEDNQNPPSLKPTKMGTTSGQEQQGENRADESPNTAE